MNPTYPKNIRLFEITATLATGIGKLIFMHVFDLRFPFIVGVITFWSLYVTYRIQKNRQLLEYWGLTFKSFRATFLELLPIAALTIAVFFGIGYYFQTNIISWHILPVLLLYPIWGIVQQFLTLSLFGKNVKDLEGQNLPLIAVILLTSVLFAIVHFPYPYLIAGTFLLALVYTTLYFKGRNLIVMGVYHGWLAAFFFYVVLARDPLMETFGKMIFVD